MKRMIHISFFKEMCSFVFCSFSNFLLQYFTKVGFTHSWQPFNNKDVFCHFLNPFAGHLSAAMKHSHSGCIIAELSRERGGTASMLAGQVDWLVV